MEHALTPATPADRDLIKNLAAFYFYDLAESGGWPFPDAGRFDIANRLDNYWGLPGFHTWPAHWKGFPFVVRVDGHPAGFALVKQIGDATFDMGEFFIGRQYRRTGLGRRIATALFDRFIGQWEVRELVVNTPAQAFWRKIIGDYAGGAFTEAVEEFSTYGNTTYVVQRFRSRSAT